LLQILSFQIDNFVYHLDSDSDAISFFPATVETPTP